MKMRPSLFLPNTAQNETVCAGRPVRRSHCVQLINSHLTTIASRTIKQAPPHPLKGKVALVQARRAYRRNGGITPFFVSLSTTQRRSEVK